MKIVADENIPLVERCFGRYGELVLKPGRSIQRKDVMDADILLVRSITQVNQALLQDTPVRFVGSATTGFDHLDTGWLDKVGIQWAVAIGCNTQAVVEYVICVIAALQEQGLLLKQKKRAAVIGVGRIGSKVVENLKALGFDVTTCDPLRAKIDKNFTSTSLEELKDLDLISLHLPLTFQGDHPTFQLIDKVFLQRQKPGCVLMNSGRGATICFEDLKHFGKHLYWCFDVWENEPDVDRDVLRNTLIATPHIAGYSLQGKYRGTEMIFEAACHFGLISHEVTSKIEFPLKYISFENQSKTWRDIILEIYDPTLTSQDMKNALLTEENSFDSLRKNFRERYEFENIRLQDVQFDSEAKRLLDFFGLKRVSL